MWHALSLPQTGYEPASGRREALPETLLTDAMRCLAFWKFNYNSTPEPADAQMAARHSPLKGARRSLLRKSHPNLRGLDDSIWARVQAPRRTSERVLDSGPAEYTERLYMSDMRRPIPIVRMIAAVNNKASRCSSPTYYIGMQPAVLHINLGKLQQLRSPHLNPS